ncbi:MAG: HD domain-containing protein [Candidatus Woesearchaeota archaeon]
MLDDIRPTLDKITEYASAPNLEGLIGIYRKLNPGLSYENLKTCLEISHSEHGDQPRFSGEPFFAHPLRVAYIAGYIQNNTDNIYIGILHDSIEDSKEPDKVRNRIYNEMGVTIFLGVSGMGTLKKIPPEEKNQLQFDRIRYFKKQFGLELEAIKIADVLDNLPTISYLPESKTHNALDRQKVYCNMVRSHVIPICEDTVLTDYLDTVVKREETRITEQASCTYRRTSQAISDHRLS